MAHLPRTFFVVLLVLTISFVGGAPTQAQIEWDGEDSQDFWSFIGNWDPDVLPTASDTVIIDANVDTIVDTDFAIKGLQMGSGAQVDTGRNQLEVLGGDIEMDSGTLVVSDNGSSAALRVNAGDIMIQSNSVLSMMGGLAEIDGTVQNSNDVRGIGHIRFLNSLGSAQTVFNNNGELQATPGTLRISAADTDARFDLDGSAETGIVNVLGNATLDIDVALTDFFGSAMILQSGSKLDMAHSWQVSSGGEIRGTAAAGQTATIRGAQLTARNGSLVNVASGRLAIESDFTSTATSTISLAPQTGLQLGGTANIHGNLLLGAQSELTINDDTTIAAASVDLDGTNNDATITVGENAMLTVESNSIGVNNWFNGTMNINNGKIDVGGIGDWRLNGVLNMASAAFTPSTLTSASTGQTLDIYGSVNASGNGAKLVNHFVEFHPSSNTYVEAGTLALVFSHGSIFHGGSNHTGGGELRLSSNFNSPVEFRGDTTINMPAGVVALDASSTQAKKIILNANATINAAELTAFGTTGNPTDTIEINDFNKLTVNLTDANSQWTLGQNGRIHISGSGGTATSLAGSDILVQGEIDVDKNTRFDARVTLEGHIDINQVATSLFLDGGSVSDPNALAGGMINGPGRLKSTVGLIGFGTIGAPIEFGTGADLFAEEGTMTVSGGILAVGDVGAKAGATLQFNSPFDTSLANKLQLFGGSVTGGAIKNFGLTQGHGLILSGGLTNDSRIVAAGGDLVINTATAPDLDGESTTGRLEALAGNIVVVNPLADSFGGQAWIGAGRSIDFQQSWIQETAGALEFRNGTSASHAVLRGALAQLNGTVEIDGNASFEAPTLIRGTSQFDMPNSDDMLFLAANATVQPGASFSGNGEIFVQEGTTLTMNIGSNVGVEVISAGTMQASAGLGAVSFGDDLILMNTSTTRFRLGGINSYDKMLVDGVVELNGDLLVQLVSGFVPDLNDGFLLLDGDFRSGVFDSLTLPTLGLGLDWTVDYTNFGDVILRVVADTISGDFDGNGDYACADVDSLVAEIVAGNNNSSFDLTGDGQVTLADLTAWLAEAGAAELTSGNPYLPADANLDGLVSGHDFLTWNANKFSTGNGWCGGDFNADGTTDGADFIVWNANKFTSANAGTSAVPEPSSALMLLMAAMLGGVRICRQR